MAKFKIGDIIIFDRDINTHLGHYLLIPAKTPCKILTLTKDHVVVEVILGCIKTKPIYKVRRIENRMIKVTGLGKVLYG